jgi:hypothetical protein
VTSCSDTKTTETRSNETNGTNRKIKKMEGNKEDEQRIYETKGQTEVTTLLEAK